MLTILWNQMIMTPGTGGMAIGIQDNKKKQEKRKREEEQRKRKARRDDVDLLEMCGMITKVL